jgi:hypothetical protein
VLEIPAIWKSFAIDSIKALMREWETAALAETTIIEADEPRVIYRDKIAAAAAS